MTAAIVIGPLMLFGSQPTIAQALQDMKTIHFDLWCQEQARLPPNRCDKRLPKDEKAFEAFRDSIENTEIPIRQERERKDQMERSIMNSDPVDSPSGRN